MTDAAILAAEEKLATAKGLLDLFGGAIELALTKLDEAKNDLAFGSVVTEASTALDNANIDQSEMKDYDVLIKSFSDALT